MRSVPEWVGKTDDAPVPPRVRARVFLAYLGLCNCCGTKIAPGQKWDLDHFVPLSIGGGHRESNLVPILREHHKAKTRQDVARKAKASRTRARHIGVKTKRHSMPGSRDSRYKRHLDGRVTLRDKGNAPKPTPAEDHPSDGHDTLTTTVSDCRPATPQVPSETAGRFFIKTKRLEIVPLKLVRFAHLAALNDKYHMYYSEQRHAIHTAETQRAYINAASKDFMPLDLMLPETSIGTMSIYFDHRNKVADMGIMVLPQYTDKGYGTEAWSAVMEWLLAEGGMQKVEAGMRSDNLFMRALCSNARMRYEGRRLKHFLVEEGAPRLSMIMYGKVRQ